ncbi:MAG: tRNA (guanosine(46)-N7)-methyltransferase TrmB [Desulfuromonadales bacterium]|nr:tRNA (guanosine(46)-N7)-methyltransferase TrmB [Desulfuromonadales bacterium]NIR33910.1 tRNA (guanosine(46)-N7)-methyltransferase TrmB [Desulfuromonadales bacterium]NIS40095.1 tRNA (guanosine(46)-N7)-methyltransferase TrmB [Desulfuromonadales bacterium]
MSQCIIEIDSPRFLELDNRDRAVHWPDIFGNDRPLELEIGCGTGHFLIEMARRNPQVNYLGIDIYNRGCDKSCRKADAARTDNVRVARTEARQLLAHHIDRAQLQAVYINCPDPWPKKRHRKRRLVQRNFLEHLRYCLKPGGSFYFCTDFTDYAEQVAGTLPEVEGLTNALPVPVAEEIEGYPVSKYMRRFLDRGERLYYMHYRKDADFRDEDHPPPGIPRFYSHLWDRAAND